jgi:hydroxypyruvate reductase
LTGRSPAPARRLLLDCYAAALAAVDARACAGAALAECAPGPVDAVVAGKAAYGMLRALLDAPHLELGRAVVAAPTALAPELAGDGRLDRHVAGHPLPDQGSLAAGAAALALASSSPRLLVLLSGGASAMLEAPRAGHDLAALRALNADLLASGLPIAALNRVRAAVSRIKGGGLARARGAAPTEVLFLSDVEGDDPAVVGGGPCHAPRPVAVLPERFARLIEAAGEPPPTPVVLHRRIADNARARSAALAHARELGVATFDHGPLSGDAATVGAALAGALAGLEPGVHAWGGECTVRLPADAGRGGRCQQLALAAAPALSGERAALLACGTDGRDGPGRAAGALVDGGTLARLEDSGVVVEEALARCDAGTALAAAGELVDTGPTGTNVADLVLLVREP